MKRILCVFLAVILMLSMCGCDGEVKYERKAEYEVAREQINASKPAVERIIAVGNSSVLYYNSEKLDGGAKNYFFEDEMFAPANVFSGKFGITASEDGNILTFEDKTIDASESGYVSLKELCDTFGFDYSFNVTHNTASVSKRTYEIADVDLSLIQSAKETVLKKVKMLDEASGINFPEAGENGVYVSKPDPGWVGGFYSGINYICSYWSDDAIYKDTAHKTTEKLSGIVMANNQAFLHDIGFITYLSEYKKYLETPTEESKNIIVKAADGLMDRINNDVYIQAWGDKDNEKSYSATQMIIDTMCNLPLMAVAGELTGDEKYINAAKIHANATQKFIVRKDSTAAHTFIFNDDATGGVEKTHQGARDDSNWARGLSWYVHGMSMLYEATGDEKYLESSKEFIDTYLINCEDDLIPKWDFSHKNNKQEPFDTSAAAISACGMMNVYELTGDEFYKAAAYYIFESLYKNYSSRNDEKSNAVLYHATGNYPQGRNIDVSLIYGDYYFAELIARFTGENKGF